MMTVAPSSSGFRRHRLLAWPESGLARRATAVATAVLVGLALLIALSLFDVPDLGRGARMAVGLAGLAAALAGVSSGVAAVVAVVRGERSVVLGLPLLVAAFWVVFLLGELLFEH